MHKISQYSPESRILTTKIYHGNDLIGTERIEVSREAFVKPDANAEGQILVHNIGSDIFFVPLDRSYGFDEFVSHAFVPEENSVFSVFYDGNDNILHEKTVKLRDPFAKLQYLSSGQKELRFSERQNNQQVAHVHLLLDCVERIGADRWVNLPR